jgi:protein regulator of cytokinesis 1
VASRLLLRYVPFFQVDPGADEQYEAELERVLELRRASLSQYMLAVRSEIEGLWLELMMSDEEKDEFVGFIDGKCTSGLRAPI